MIYLLILLKLNYSCFIFLCNNGKMLWLRQKKTNTDDKEVLFEL